MKSKMGEGAILMADPVLQNFANIATITVPIIAVVAAFLAWRQIHSSSLAGRRATAFQIYHQYLVMAYENPTLAFPRLERIVGDAKQYDAYRWFVATMLLSFEEILYVCPNEEDWKRTITDQLNRHWWHLEDSHSAAQHWKPALMRLIAEVKKSQVGTRDAPRLPKTHQLLFSPVDLGDLRRRRHRTAR